MFVPQNHFTKENQNIFFFHFDNFYATAAYTYRIKIEGYTYTKKK